MSIDPHLERTGRADDTAQGAHAAHGALPRNDTVSYEARDVQVRSIYWYLIALTISVAASFFICVYVLRYTERFVSRDDTPMMPARAAMGPDYRVLPPEPRLQGVPGHDVDPQQDHRDKVRADNEANEKYGWIDQNAGIAQIPVKEAMKIIAQKGLPATPPAPEKK
ncbi:MAG TPA: hypothetical protein VH140_09845 [Candidatus Acidoferrum sp.]|jgi:hypothetical protein|nr:hypothetical protein [Candidatus Acidoferrum sp.]